MYSSNKRYERFSDRPDHRGDYRHRDREDRDRKQYHAEHRDSRKRKGDDYDRDRDRRSSKDPRYSNPDYQARTPTGQPQAPMGAQPPDSYQKH